MLFHVLRRRKDVFAPDSHCISLLFPWDLDIKATPSVVEVGGGSKLSSRCRLVSDKALKALFMDSRALLCKNVVMDIILVDLNSFTSFKWLLQTGPGLPMRFQHFEPESSGPFNLTLPTAPWKLKLTWKPM